MLTNLMWEMKEDEQGSLLFWIPGTDQIGISVIYKIEKRREISGVGDGKNREK